LRLIICHEWGVPVFTKSCSAFDSTVVRLLYYVVLYREVRRMFFVSQFDKRQH
jgi:hypothetical protein